MSVMSLIRDWWDRTGPEHWNPDEDADVREFRRSRSESEAATHALRQDPVMRAAGPGAFLRQARVDAGRPLDPGREA